MRKGDGAEVTPGLWVGSLAFAQDSQTLEGLGIVRVLTFGSRLNPQLEWHSGSILSQRGYEIEDHPCADLLGVLPSALREIDKVMKSRKDGSQPGVLVHCASGISRSVAVCTAWLMQRQALSLQEALEKVKRARPQALPNHCFVQCLQLLETADLKAAHKSWTDANAVSQNSRDRCVQKLREKADKVAEVAAALEEQLQNLDPENTSKLRGALKALRKLARDIEKLKPRRTIDDNIAHCVRKETAQKVSHLLSIWEAKLPACPEEECEEIGPTLLVDLEDEDSDQDLDDPGGDHLPSLDSSGASVHARPRVPSIECRQRVVSL